MSNFTLASLILADKPVPAIGVGDDYNEDLMAGLAEASDANYYYVQDTEKLPEIFARELGELLNVAARDVRIEIICPDGVTPLGFIGRAEKFENQKAVVNLSQFTGGQDRYLFLRCLIQGDKAEIAHVTVMGANPFAHIRRFTVDLLVKDAEHGERTVETVNGDARTGDW